MPNVGEKVGILPKSDMTAVGPDGDLIVTRTSIFTRKRNTMTLPITRAQLQDYVLGRGLIQNIFPDLSADQREFIMSGATPEEWEGMFGS